MSQRTLLYIGGGIGIAALVAVILILIPNIGTQVKYVDTVNKIVFLWDKTSPGHPHVWIVNADGTGLKELTKGNETDADPSFSPDGSQLTYVSDKSGQSEVYTMGALGGKPAQVTTGSDAKSSPEFSPDGKSIAYLSRGAITLLTLSDHSTEPILPSPEAATSTDTASLSQLAQAPVVSFAWSPPPGGDVDKDPAIAAVQEPDTGDVQALTILPKIGTAPKIIVAAKNVSFAWSPDGKQLLAALLGLQGLPDGQVYSAILTFNSDGTKAPPAPLAPSKSDTLGAQDPLYSPDSTQVAFTVVREPDPAHRQVVGLYHEPIDGSAQAQVMIQGPVSGAQFSPDGTHLLALLPNKAQTRRDLYSGGIEGTIQPTNVTKGQGDVTWARWSPALPNVK